MARVLDLIHNIASASTLLTSKQKQPTKRSPTRKSFRKKSVRRSDKVSSVDNEDYSLNSVCDNVETLEIVTPRLSDLQFRFNWSIGNFQEKVLKIAKQYNNTAATVNGLLIPTLCVTVQNKSGPFQ